MQTVTETAADATAEPRPFHETIIKVIGIASKLELECLAHFIKLTKVPANHDAIIAAWNTRRQEVWEGTDGNFGVLTYLLAQKHAASEEERATALKSLYGQVRVAINKTEEVQREISRLEEAIAKLANPETT